MSLCRKQLAVDATETDDESLIGDECHIVAQSEGGPRGVSLLTKEQRDKYANLILLCKNHHKMIDDQPGEYTVENLHQIKRDHENWVQTSLESYDPSKQRDDEAYASLIEEFAKRTHLDEWQNWTSYVLGGGGYPRISKQVHGDLKETRQWLLSRVWPQRYTSLEASLNNFRHVLQDFMNTFDSHAIPYGDSMLATEKFYKIPEWNPDRYEQLVKQYEFHVDLVQDLMLELTRSANYVCDKVREFITSSFRIEEGVLLAEHGPYEDFSYRMGRYEYRGTERTNKPYPGLEEFKLLRFKRDHYFGRPPT